MKLYDTFVDEKDICLVFEYLPGQDLFWVLTNEHNLQLSSGGRKAWVTFYCSEILLILKYLHE